MTTTSRAKSTARANHHHHRKSSIYLHTIQPKKRHDVIEPSCTNTKHSKFHILPTHTRRTHHNKYQHYSKVAHVASPENNDIVTTLLRYQDYSAVTTKSNSSSSTTRRRTHNTLQYPPLEHINPQDPSTFGYTKLGVILGAHGLNGFMILRMGWSFPLKDMEKDVLAGVYWKAPNRCSPRKVTLLEFREKNVPVYVPKIKKNKDDKRLTHKKKKNHKEYRIRLDGITDRTMALSKRGWFLYIREAYDYDNYNCDEEYTNERNNNKNKKHDEGYYWIRDLVGCQVVIIQSEKDKCHDVLCDNDDDKNNKENKHVEDRSEENGSMKQKKYIEEQKKEYNVVGNVSGIILGKEMCNSLIYNSGNTKAERQDLLEVTLLSKNTSNENDGDASSLSWKKKKTKNKNEKGIQRVLIPFVKNIVVDVDVHNDQRLVFIDPPKGTLELKYIRGEMRKKVKGLLIPVGGI